MRSLRIAIVLLASFAPLTLAAQFANRPLVSGPVKPNPNLFPANANAKADIKAALLQATKQKKRVLLEFGGLWCYDCHVLDHAFHSVEIKPLLDANYVVVHVDVGNYDKNLDLAKKYEIPLEKGVPVLAVLDNNGKLLFSQKNHEFSAARNMTVQDVTAFLNKWKPAK
jgi:thioredoxin 1